ncbi:MAG TPA: hypothetical protein VLD84_09360 [Nitrososphaeraceae archaeon]|nr:hypothetical protein [Nitrososphaeraceae archaeon]
MLKYNETNWQNKEGFKTQRYQVSFNEVKSHSAIEEQKERTERLSLVKFFIGSHHSLFLDICTNFKKNDDCFYFDKSKKFHCTLLGFPVVEPFYYDAIMQRITQYIQVTKEILEIQFDTIRLGTKYEDDDTLKPISGVSNGTIIAYGDGPRNNRFTTFANNLVTFLSTDEKMDSVLGSKFRRRFPGTWCTMGYYTRDFKITSRLERLFNQYKGLRSEDFLFPCTELELGTSHYKDLRDWKPIHKFII